MAFEWLEAFHRKVEKRADYAEKTLAAYALGMRGKGSIGGVVVEVGTDCCDAARQLAPGEVYQPSTAPRLPLPGCPRGGRCSCAYRPLMTYQRDDKP